MGNSAPLKRRRLTVDLPAESEAATRSLTTRYFRGVTTDTVRASLSLLSWVLEARRSGKRVIAVPADSSPERYEEPVLAGVEEQLNDVPDWLVARPHPWRTQLWIKVVDSRQAISLELLKSKAGLRSRPQRSSIFLWRPFSRRPGIWLRTGSSCSPRNWRMRSRRGQADQCPREAAGRRGPRESRSCYAGWRMCFRKVFCRPTDRRLTNKSGSELRGSPPRS